MDTRNGMSLQAEMIGWHKLPAGIEVLQRYILYWSGASIFMFSYANCNLFAGSTQLYSIEFFVKWIFLLFSREYREKQFRARARGGQTLTWFIIAIVWLRVSLSAVVIDVDVDVCAQVELKFEPNWKRLADGANNRQRERGKTATNSIKISSKICKNAPKAKRNEAKEKYYS